VRIKPVTHRVPHLRASLTGQRGHDRLPWHGEGGERHRRRRAQPARGGGELTWAWLDGKPAGADTNFYSYWVDLLNNEQDIQYNVTVKSTDGVLLDDGLDLVYDSDADNRFHVSTAALAAGNAYLAALAGAGSSYQTARATWLDVPSRKGQDQVTRTPEPATLLLLSTGLASLALRRRNKSQA
jgi:PEP-CTERM motif